MNRKVHAQKKQQLQKQQQTFCNAAINYFVGHTLLTSNFKVILTYSSTCNDTQIKQLHRRPEQKEMYNTPTYNEMVIQNEK
jgi:hypothetical protein